MGLKFRGRRSSLKRAGVPEKNNYNIVPERLYHPDLGEYSTYGIQVTAPGYIDIVHDVSVCRKMTLHMVKVLNRYEVSLIHLDDVIEDMLS